MDDGDALLAAIAAHPDNDTPRLIYADWLEERADAVSVTRAQYIRASVEHAKWFDPHEIGPLCEAERKAMASQMALWVPALWPVPPCESLHALGRYTWMFTGGEGFALHGTPEQPGHRADYRRGFCELVVMPLRVWERYAPTLLALEPLIRTVILTSHVNEQQASALSDLWPEIQFTHNLTAGEPLK